MVPPSSAAAFLRAGDAGGGGGGEAAIAITSAFEATFFFFFVTFFFVVGAGEVSSDVVDLAMDLGLVMLLWKGEFDDADRVARIGTQPSRWHTAIRVEQATA